MPILFISYRRDDESGFALALYTRLQQSLPEDHLFMDVAGSIPLGSPFPDILKGQLARCDVLLAIIGEQWLFAQDEAGRRRLDDPEDWVRIEIETALRRGKRVVPVLINSTRMPLARDLPKSMQELAGRQAFRLSQERFAADVQDLQKFLALAQATSVPADRPQSAHGDQNSKAPTEGTLAQKGIAAKRLLDAFWIALIGSVAGIVITFALKQSAILESFRPQYIYLYVIVVAIIVMLLSVWRYGGRTSK